MPSFRASIGLLGINPFVELPPAQLRALLVAAGRDTGAIPIRVELGGISFRQNLVKYRGAWRLYLNLPMRKAAGRDVGDRVQVKVEFDPEPRVEPMPAVLRRALDKKPRAKAAFAALAPSRKKEILRYLNGVKTAATLERNVDKVIAYLSGESPPGLAVLTFRRSGSRRSASPSSGSPSSGSPSSGSPSSGSPSRAGKPASADGPAAAARRKRR